MKMVRDTNRRYREEWKFQQGLQAFWASIKFI